MYLFHAKLLKVFACVSLKQQKAGEQTRKRRRRRKKKGRSVDESEDQQDEMDSSSNAGHGVVAGGESFQVKDEDGLDDDDGDANYQENEIDDESRHFNDTSDRVEKVRRKADSAENKNRGSPVWKYFVPQQSGAVCKFCRKTLKRSGGNTSNLFQHLKRAHRKQYATMMGEHGRRKMEAATRHMVLLPLL